MIPPSYVVGGKEAAPAKGGETAYRGAAHSESEFSDRQWQSHHKLYSSARFLKKPILFLLMRYILSILNESIFCAYQDAARRPPNGRKNPQGGSCFTFLRVYYRIAHTI